VLVSRELLWLFWFVIGSCPLVADIFDDYKVWSSGDGRQIEARVLSIDPEAETVRMERPGGTAFTAAWKHFSDADQTRLAAASVSNVESTKSAGEPPLEKSARPKSAQVELPERLELKDVPMVEQKGNFCVPASATMVAGYHGIETDQDEVARLSSEMSASNEGTYPSDMLLAMNKLGFEGRPLYWKTSEEFFTSILPAIRQQLFEAGPIYISFKPGVFGSMGHGCVIVGYDDRKQELLFHNPWGNTFESEYVKVAGQAHGIVLIDPPLAAPIASPELIDTIKKLIPRFEGDFIRLAKRLDQSDQGYKLVWCSRRDARGDRRFAEDTARDDGRKILELAFERNPAVIIPYSPSGTTEKYYFVTRPPEGGARFLVRAIDAQGWQEAELYTLGSLTRNWATEIEVSKTGEKIWELPMIELHPSRSL